MHPLLQEMVARAQHEDVERFIAQQQRLRQLPTGPALSERIRNRSARLVRLLPLRVRLLLNPKTTHIH